MDNLYTAYCKARKGKRRRPDVAGFTLDLEQNLSVLQRELVTGIYTPGAYRQFTVYERKPRLISVAPFPRPSGAPCRHAHSGPLAGQTFHPGHLRLPQEQGRAPGGRPLPAVFQGQHLRI